MFAQLFPPPPPRPYQRARPGRVVNALLPCTDQAPAAARRITTASIGVWDVDGTAADAVQLIVSELVTNAVRHTSGPDLLLTVLLGRRRIGVAVMDRGPRPRGPWSVPPGTAMAEGGRGLELVAGTATRWGHHRLGRGSLVWAHVPVTRESPL